MLINAEIKEIVYLDGYPDELALSLLEESGLQVRSFIPATQAHGEERP